jgi:hypothetical protein
MFDIGTRAGTRTRLGVNVEFLISMKALPGSNHGGIWESARVDRSEPVDLDGSMGFG